MPWSPASSAAAASSPRKRTGRAPPSPAISFAARGTAQPGPAKLLLRPESLHLADAGIPAIVDSLSYKGPVYELHLTIAGTGEPLVLDSPEPVSVGAGVKVAVTDAWIIPA